MKSFEPGGLLRRQWGQGRLEEELASDGPRVAAVQSIPAALPNVGLLLPLGEGLPSVPSSAHQPRLHSFIHAIFFYTALGINGLHSVNTLKRVTSDQT